MPVPIFFFRKLRKHRVLGRVAKRLADAFDEKERAEHAEVRREPHEGHHDEGGVSGDDEGPVPAGLVADPAGYETQRVAEKLARSVEDAHHRGACAKKAEVLAVGAAGALVNDVAEAAHQSEKEHDEHHAPHGALRTLRTRRPGLFAPSLIDDNLPVCHLEPSFAGTLLPSHTARLHYGPISGERAASLVVPQKMPSGIRSKKPIRPCRSGDGMSGKGPVQTPIATPIG